MELQNRGQDIEKYKLGHPHTFHYLNQSTCFKLDDVDDAHDYLSTRKAMDVVGISGEEQDMGLFETISVRSLLRRGSPSQQSRDRSRIQHVTRGF
ncbi:myosin 1 [Perilla frutescens var. hirtella]|nr:myosin 1 [Perilla frutescens var. hirtella]KAH6812478.1 myosin 1 [Perilla frutescens var. frutescens]